MMAAVTGKASRVWSKLDLPVFTVYAVLAVLVLLALILFPDNLSVGYYLQQVQIASVLGVLALGAMFVILLGEIDLSVPWVLTGAAMIACGIHSASEPGSLLALLPIPAALVFGFLAGLWNGLGVAYLRAPSMVWTLGTNALLLGISVFYAGGYNPQTDASPLMRTLAVGRIFGEVPVSAVIWAAVVLIAGVLLYRTPLGAWIYARGRSEKVLYLAGIRSKRVTLFAFVWAGLCSAIGGVLLAGYAGQSYQAMGNPMLLPTIAAVVLGGTRIQGGEGKISGVIGGVLVLTLLTSLLSLLQTPESIRQISYGFVILTMLLLSAGTRAERP